MPIKELVLIYIVPFLFSWFAFCSEFLVAYPEFIEEYGLLAYQPCTFLVVVLTVTFMNVMKIGVKRGHKEISVVESYKRVFVVMVKMFITVAVGLAFYMIVLDGKPNLFICL